MNDLLEYSLGTHGDDIVIALTGGALLEKAPTRILVVEYKQELRRQLKRDLLDMGHDVHAVDTVWDATQLLSDGSFAAVVTGSQRIAVELTRWIAKHSPHTEVIPAHAIHELRSSRRLETPAAGADRRVSHAQLLSVLDHLHLGVFVTDPAGTVLQLNRKARAIINQQDGLRLGPGARLHPWPFADGAADHAVTLRRRSGRAPLSLLLVQLDSGGLRDDDDPPRMALFVSDPEDRGATIEEVLCKLYGLTKAEARVTQRLVQGRSVEQIASDLAVHRNTVRAHLKQAFQKTGTSRQAELVSLVLTGPACLVPDQDNDLD